jgi:hypothetical protein
MEQGHSVKRNEGKMLHDAFAAAESIYYCVDAARCPNAVSVALSKL